MTTEQTAANDIASDTNRDEPMVGQAEDNERHAREAIAYLNGAMDDLIDLFIDAQLNASGEDGSQIGLDTLRQRFADGAVALRLAKGEIERIVSKREG